MSTASSALSGFRSSRAPLVCGKSISGTVEGKGEKEKLEDMVMQRANKLGLETYGPHATTPIATHSRMKLIARCKRCAVYACARISHSPEINGRPDHLLGTEKGPVRHKSDPILALLVSPVRRAIPDTTDIQALC